MSNNIVSENNNTIQQMIGRQPFEFSQREDNGLIITTLTIPNSSQETIDNINRHMASGNTIDTLIMNYTAELVSLPYRQNIWLTSQPTYTFTDKLWLEDVYYPIDRKFIDEGENYCICMVTFEPIKTNDKYIFCETCEKCFSIEVKDSWVNTHHNCPHCRSQWQDYTIYINANEKKIMAKIRKLSYKSRKFCNNLQNKKWQFKNKFYRMTRNKRKWGM